MDVYGAFQLCSIGILTAPLSVRYSKTYFDNPGRNTIFLWTGLILAGKCCLTAGLKQGLNECRRPPKLDCLIFSDRHGAL